MEIRTPDLTQGLADAGPVLDSLAVLFLGWRVRAEEQMGIKLGQPIEIRLQGGGELSQAFAA